jgi:putative oxidoreductase
MDARPPATDPLPAWGILLLRVAVGAVFLVHGWVRLVDFGIGETAQSFGSQGVPVPGLVAVGVTAVETLGGVALIVGLLTRWVALLLVAEMVAAALLVDVGTGFFAGDQGIELGLILEGACLALILTGPGPLVADTVFHRRHRERNWASQVDGTPAGTGRGKGSGDTS